MKILHAGLVIAIALSALILIMSSLNPQLAVMAARPTLPADDPVPVFTRYITIEVELAAPAAAALWSRWQHATLEFPANSGTVQVITLPDDSQAITASISFGQVTVSGTVITFTYSGTASTYYAYRTAQKVPRLGNEYRIDQYTWTNRDFRLISNLFFPVPYGYVGSITFTPQLVISPQLGISGTAHWDYVVPWDGQSRSEFATSTWLVDPRLGQPDLSIIAANLSIASGLNPPIAQLTATVRNNNDVDIASTDAFLEFYDRAAPSAPPDGPLDHAGGWCGTGSAPTCPASATFTNPIPSLASGASVTVYMTYPLQLPGLRDYYFQIDTFGGPNGLNLEFDEGNNVYTLTRSVTIDYLASVAISGPLTGTAHTPIGFHAQVTPALAISRPLTYTWSPAPFSGQGTADATYTWGSGTPQAITVTARNANQTTVTGTHTISIEIPLTGAIITGPITVSKNSPHAYRASAQPMTATQPLSYAWEPEPTEGQATEVATYTLTDLGVHSLKVSMGNPIGPVVTATHVVVSVPPLAAVAIDGPQSSPLNAISRFTATINPLNAAPPLDYQWSPPPNTGQGTAQVQYYWGTNGPKFITVTVVNDSGTVSSQHAIEVEGSSVYLPLIRK
jgi:hypothetical protein